MDKNRFLIELRGLLRHLPPDELESAMEYYAEYFNEAGPENEQKVIAELISPSNVAAKIIGEIGMNPQPWQPQQQPLPQQKNRSVAKTVWIVILGIFASPIALPIAIALFAVALALVISLGSVIFAFVVTGGALVLAGVMAFFISFTLLFRDFPTALFFMGYGLTTLSVGLLMCLGFVKLGILGAKGISRSFGKILVRRSKNEKIH